MFLPPLFSVCILQSRTLFNSVSGRRVPGILTTHQNRKNQVLHLVATLQGKFQGSSNKGVRRIPTSLKEQFQRTKMIMNQRNHSKSQQSLHCAGKPTKLAPNSMHVCICPFPQSTAIMMTIWKFNYIAPEFICHLTFVKDKVK